ncbi:myosin heavy [Cyclospora cayetanensis]|uniref:Myosin heavy n=1 Tax=Cyclospora cayetanensis TaxID=88456 RepID=A0A1D3DB02_9EIME|nr:myosin heavy [Cyclospora cayetanensis]
MDADNFAKLTTILDLLDRCKKNLSQAIQQETPMKTRSSMHAGHTLSKRSTRNEGIFDFGTHGGLDQELQECILSRGLMHIFDSSATSNGQSAEPIECDVQSECLDYFSEESEHPPDVDWEEMPQRRRFSTCSLENMTTEDYTHMHPQILGQLFDRILDYLQNDFDELVEKLKEQNGHLKQDVISLRKKLDDAVETNDEQVQELKEMTERILDVEAEGRELTRQLNLMEARIKRYQDNQKGVVKLEEEKHNLGMECAALQERIKELTIQVSAQDMQKVAELAHDLVTLKGTTQAKDEEIKSLKRELDRKGRLLESLNVTIAAQQMYNFESPRGDITSRQLTPRSSISHLLAGITNPRRAAVRQRFSASVPSNSEHSMSLATELQQTTPPPTLPNGCAALRLRGPLPLLDPIAGLVVCLLALIELSRLRISESCPVWLREAQDRLKAALAEMESLRLSNEALKEQMVELRQEMEAKDAFMRQSLEANLYDALRDLPQESSQHLATTREQLAKESAELERTTKALQATKDDLRTSIDALNLTTADNEKLLAEVEEAKRLLRDAQEHLTDALASRASPEVVRGLEDKVAVLIEELRTKAMRLDECEKYQKELEEQRVTLQNCVENSMKQIDELSSRVESLEGQLIATTNVANALGAEISKLLELVERGSVSDKEREEAEKQREALLALMRKWRGMGSDAQNHSECWKEGVPAEPCTAWLCPVLFDTKLEGERHRAAALAQNIAQQRVVEEEQREFAESAYRLQKELQHQVNFLRSELARREGETEAMRQRLDEQADAAEKAKQSMQIALCAAYDKLQARQVELEGLLREKADLEMASTDGKLQMQRLQEESQATLEERDQELQEVKRQMEEYAAKIDYYVSREAAYTSEADRLREDISALELGLQTAKEEGERLLALKHQETRQLKEAQKAALAAMQEQVDALKKERRALRDAAPEAHDSKLLSEYEALLKAVKDLREQNTLLSAALDEGRSGHVLAEEKLQQKHAALLSSFHEAQKKYEELQKVLDRTTSEYHKSLEDAQRQLADLKPQLTQMAADHQGREAKLMERIQELEQTRLCLQAEVAELKERNGSALVEATHKAEAEALRAEKNALNAQIEQLHALIKAKDMQRSEALEQTEENQKLIQQLLDSLQEHQRRLEEADKLLADKSSLQVEPDELPFPCAEETTADDIQLKANARMWQENESLKGQLEELKAMIMVQRRDTDSAGVLDMLQHQLQNLAREFSAFKKVEAQQLMDLKGAIGGTTQVFNVSYPPFIIPLVNVHESKDKNDKTINISGMLDIRAAATGLAPSVSKGLSQARRSALQGSRFQDVLCRWQGRCWTATDSFWKDCSCTPASDVHSSVSDRWMSQTQVFKPADMSSFNVMGENELRCLFISGKDEVHAMRVQMGAFRTSPRVEGPLQLSGVALSPRLEAGGFAEHAAPTKAF